MIDAGGGKRCAGFLADAPHVAHHQSLHQGAVVRRQAALEIITNLAPDIFDKAARDAGLAPQQFDLLIVVDERRGINRPPRQIGRVVEAARIAAVLGSLRAHAQAHAVTVTPVAPDRAQTDENVAVNFFGAGGMPNALGAQLPAGSLRQPLRLIGQRAF